MIEFKNVSKVYPNGVKALNNVSLTIDEGEFVGNIGLTGAGKSTLIRAINRMHPISDGSLIVDDVDVSTLRGAELRKFRRGIGMIFQSFNLVTRSTVIINVLTAKVPDLPFWRGLLGWFPKKDKIDALQALDNVDILEKAYSRADQLSGGQQQRVALARALVIKPDVLLMDEPLSNLDAKLRVEMRTVIKQIQKEVGITTVYVTHDQEEAMAISDRIAVMKDGEIRHCSTPQNIYLRPADLFVATFIGKSNLINAELIGREQNAVVKFSNGYEVELDTVRNEETFDRNVTVSIRPEEFKIIKTESIDDDQGIHGVIKDSIFLGLNTHYLVTLETGEDVEIIQESSIDKIIPEGSSITLVVNSEKMNVFDTDTTLSLMKDVNNNIVIDAQGVGETHD